MRDDNYEGFCQWPVGRTERGELLVVRIEWNGKMTREAFERFKAFISIWELAWFPPEQGGGRDKEAQAEP